MASGRDTTDKDSYTIGFDSIDIDDVPKVGGKNASLGEMYQQLVPRGIQVPDGFATTADAFRYFLRETGLDADIADHFEGLDTDDVAQLRRRARDVREAILEAEFPADLADAIQSAYRRLSDGADQPVDVAVRSSATAEDLPDASFAGQQESYLNIRGDSQLLEACRKCFASLFTDRAVSYRAHHDFSLTDIALSVGVQRMVRSDVGAAGVAFSIDTETGFEDAVLINAAWGLGESVVKGTVNPDEYYVFKPTLKDGYDSIIQKSLGSKESKIIYDEDGLESTKTVPTRDSERHRFALDEDQILKLARWTCTIEEHYSERHGRQMPMDVEWALDGETGELFVVQARPETVQSRRKRDVLRQYKLEGTGEVLVQGRSVGEMIATGEVQHLDSADQIESFKEGGVLVTDTTDPNWEPIMKRASAIVTNRGGRTSHAAIVSRELGLPAIVGTGDATSQLQDGQMVTVSCSEGEVGNVYRGELDFSVEEISLTGLERPDTEIMMNVGDPGEAFRNSFIPNDGVGLAREEFIVSNHIGIHPMALLQPDQLDDDERHTLDKMTRGYDTNEEFFISQLSQGVAMIGAAFYPEDVIVRLSDFKSNEYATLLGGTTFETDEANPMLGFRGASRYYDEDYREAFRMECRALKRVRDGMGLTNIKIMVPFCRTPEEGRRVQQIMEEEGLERGKNGLELYVMCEIPSNVLVADDFAELFDGFSIGSNDLTQLVLGVDRDSEKLAHLFDERDEAVKEMIRMVIDRAHQHGRKVGICGQAPSDYPEFARFLVDAGIDSISLTPDTVMKTTLDLAGQSYSPDG
jgi:pyruvate,water dikinase